MGRRDIVASLDIGTSYTRIIIGEINSYGTLNIIGYGSTESQGMRKGVVVDIDGVAKSIVDAKDQAERMAGVEISKLYIGLPATHVDIISNKGVVAVSGEDKEITIEDVERALQAARVVAVPANREIVDVIPRQFVLDGYEGIHDPVGMVGVRLEVETMLVSANKNVVQNILRCVEKADCNVLDFVLNPLAASEVCISADEKELGVVLLDAGAGTIEISSFLEGSLNRIAGVSLGGDHISSDIAVGLKTTIAAAEEIKVSHGFASDAGIVEPASIEIASVGHNRSREIDEAVLAGIIEPRVEEMFHYINNRLDEMGYSEPPAAGIVMIGGVGAMQGFADYGEYYLGLPIRRGEVKDYGVEDSLAITAVGIVVYAAKYKQEFSRRKQPDRRSDNTKLVDRVFGWLKELWE